LHDLLAVVAHEGQRADIAVAADTDAREVRHLLVLEASEGA
jgi:hypothetical protein